MSPAVDVETVREHHPHGALRIERQVRRNSSGKLEHHGQWKWWDASGRLMAAGVFENGQRQGPWIRIHFREEGGVFQEPAYADFSSPFSSEALFDQGKMNGLWTMRDAQGRPITTIAYRHGQRHGTATWWYANGAKLQEIEYIDGLMDGEVVKWNPAGEEIFRRSFQAGRELVVSSKKYPQGQKMSSVTVLAAPLVPEGEDDWWTGERTIYQVEGQDARQGISVQWYPNGQTRRHGDFDRDLPVSTHTWWHPNGAKSAQGDYRLGRMTGRWTWWHPNGNEAATGEYRDGEPIGAWTWTTADGMQISRGSPALREHIAVDDRDAAPLPPAKARN